MLVYRLKYHKYSTLLVYLLNDNGVIKNYDKKTNSLVEVDDTSILNVDGINNILNDLLSEVVFSLLVGI